METPQSDPRAGAAWGILARYDSSTPPLALDQTPLLALEGYTELVVLDTVLVRGYHIRDADVPINTAAAMWTCRGTYSTL